MLKCVQRCRNKDVTWFVRKKRSFALRKNSGTSQRFGVCVAKPDGMWEFAANCVQKIGISHLAFYPVLEIELAEQIKESQVKCGIIQ